MPDDLASASLDATWPLVGRDELLARVIAALGARGARMTVLTGESGVGKSRLSSAAADVLSATGDLVLPVPGNIALATVPLGVAAGLLPSSPAPEDPVALFETVRGHLAGLAGGRRIVLHVDDVAWLDPVTTALVSQLVAARVATLLATVRSGDPLPDALAAQWAPDDCARLDVPPFTPAEAGDVLQGALGGPVAWHVTDELHAASGGNALYLRELAIGAVGTGRLAVVAGVWQLTGAPVPTPALRELVIAHVRRLDDDARDLVERLAVCGELPVDHFPGTRARAALGRLEASGMVTVTAGAGGLAARLAQQQYGAVVREGLSVLRVADIGREHADLLAASSDRPEDTLRIALWRLDGGIRVDDATLLEAASQARRARDHRTVERLTAASAGAEPRLLLLRGEALSRLGRLPEALAALDTAGSAARSSDADPALVMAIATATAFTHASRVDGTSAALAALDALPPALAASPGAAIIRSTILLYEHRVTEARVLLERIAPAFDGSAFERAIHAHALAPALSFQGEDAAALDAALLARDAARAGGAFPVPLAMAEATHAEVLLQAGRLADAFDAGIRALRAATSGDDQFTTRYIEFLLGRTVLEQGHLEAAARWFREAASGATARGPESLVAPAVGGLALIHLSRDDHAAAEAALARVPPGTPERNPTTVLARGIIAARAGDLETARRVLGDAARELEDSGDPFLAGVHLFTLARWGDPASAATGLERLVAAGAGEFTTLQALEARALAEADRAGLVAIGEEWERRGAVLYAAEALASAARAAQSAGDGRVATALQARSDALAATSQGAATPLLRFSTALVPLTTREREIAALAAQGASSRDIADRLFLSVRTVDNHLQSIYGKLGIRGRRELADALG